MKQRKMKKYAGAFYKKMDLCSLEIALSFDEEAIHDWRLVYKKLRAFFRLVNEAAGKEKIETTKGLKKIYSLLGSLRDQQLLQERLDYTAIDTGEELPANLVFAQGKMIKLKADVLALLAGDASKKSRRKTSYALPGLLNLPPFSAWFKQNCHRVKEMLSTAPLTDDKIHAIRKILKDMVYNLEIYRQQQHFPPGTWKEKITRYFNPLLEQLGNYQDSCTALGFIESCWLKHLHTEHRERLALIKEVWQNEKSIARQLLVTALATDEVIATGSLQHIPIIQYTDL